MRSACEYLNVGRSFGNAGKTVLQMKMQIVDGMRLAAPTLHFRQHEEDVRS
jgi:hypothetical protein